MNSDIIQRNIDENSLTVVYYPSLLMLLLIILFKKKKKKTKNTGNDTDISDASASNVYRHISSTPDANIPSNRIHTWI